MHVWLTVHALSIKSAVSAVVRHASSVVPQVIDIPNYHLSIHFKVPFKTNVYVVFTADNQLDYAYYIFIVCVSMWVCHVQYVTRAVTEPLVTLLSFLAHFLKVAPYFK